MAQQYYYDCPSRYASATRHNTSDSVNPEIAYSALLLQSKSVKTLDGSSLASNNRSELLLRRHAAFWWIACITLLCLEV